MTIDQREERLKIARAYRETLLHKRDETDVKIARTEATIKELRDARVFESAKDE